MSRITVIAGVLIIAMVALVLCDTASNAGEPRNINVSLNSGTNAIRPGGTLTISYTMPIDYPGGELYIRERNASDPLYFSACPGSAGTHTVTWTCNAAEGFYYVIVFGIVNDSYQDGNACSFTVDNSPPVTVASAPGGSGWRKNTVTLTARDALSGVKSLFYSLDKTTWQPCSDPGTGRITVPGGTQTISFYALDWAGNKETTKSVTYNIDDQSPVTAAALTGTAGLDGWYTSDVRVTLSASDGASGTAGTYYLLNGLENTYNGTFTLGTGTYWLTYWSRDNAGNVESPHDMTINVDTNAPVTTVSPPGGADRYVTSVVTLTATGVSGAKGLYYSFNGNDWSPCSSSDPTVGYVVLSEGTHTLYYKAQGNNGLWETARSAVFNVDTHKPVIAATLTGSQGDNGWYKGNVQVTLSASDVGSGVANIGYDLDGRSYVYSGPFTIGEGTHSLTLRGTDKAGNVNASTIGGIKVDTTAPTVTCAFLGTQSDQGFFVSDVLVTLQPSDSSAGVSYTEYRIGDGNWHSYNGQFVVSSGGPASIEYRCTDKAGNTATGSQAVNFLPAGYVAPGNGQENVGDFNASKGSNSTLKPTPTPAATPTPKPTPGLTPTPASGPSSAPSATPPPAQAQEWTSLGLPLLLIAILGAVAALAIFAFYVHRKN